METTILVTGGAGYLGSVLVNQLISLGCNVRVLDVLRFGGTSLLSTWNQRNFEFVRGDIRDQNVVRVAMDGINVVVHLAAIVGDPACARDPQQAETTNVDGTALLMEEAARANVSSFILASTCSNYGITEGLDTLADETAALAPLSLYARTKVRCEDMLLDWSQATKIPARAVRLATLYGLSQRMRFDLTVNDFAMQMHTARNLVVHAAETWRPYIHVDDAARGICSVLIAGKKARAQVYNLGSTCQNFTKAEIVDMVHQQLPEAVVQYQREGLDRRNYKVSFQRFQSEFGFQPCKRIPDAIKDIICALRTGVIADPMSAQYRN